MLHVRVPLLLQWLIAAVPVAAIHGGLAERQRFRSVLDIVPAGGRRLADVNDTIAYAQYLNRLYGKTRSRLLHDGCGGGRYVPCPEY